MVRIIGALIVMLIIASCEVDCQYEEVQLTVFHEGLELARVEGNACNSEAAVITQDDGYIIVPILNNSALNASTDPYTAFEQGEQMVEPASSIVEEGPHLVEVRNKATLQHNLNDPEVKSLVSEPEGNRYVASGEVMLTGHELQLMLALEDIEDLGGAKKWVVGKASLPDGEVIDPNTPGDWSCFLDNQYTFMKGKRLKYDPNKEDNTGELCTHELDYFTQPDEVTHVYGTYEIIQNTDKLTVRTSVNTSISDTYVVDFDILEYDWNMIKTEMVNGEGKKIIVELVPAEYPEHSDF